MVCAIALLPTLAHFILFDNATDFMYYGTAALSSLIVISVLEFIKQTPLTRDIQAIGLGYVATHFLGWGIYHAEWQPTAYNLIALVLFVIEFARLMILTKTDMDYELGGGGISIHSDANGRSHGGVG